MVDILLWFVFPVLVGFSIVGGGALASLLKNWLYSPKLRLKTDDFYVYSTGEKVGISGEYSRKAFFHHLILQNTGRTMAKNVIMKIEVLDEEGQIIDRLSQLAVEFRGYKPVDIAAKSYEVFDLCKIYETGGPDIYFTSLAGQESLKRIKEKPLGPGTYTANIFLFADNFEEKEFYKFKITRVDTRPEKRESEATDVQIKFLEHIKKRKEV